MWCAPGICLWTDSRELLSLTIFPSTQHENFIKDLLKCMIYHHIKSMHVFFRKNENEKNKSSKRMEGPSRFCKCFMEITRINIYLALETPGTLFTYHGQLCLAFSGCWFSWRSKMWSWSVWTLVPVKGLQVCIHILHISTVCQESCGWYWGIDLSQNHSCLCPLDLQGLPSTLLCILMFPQLAFLMHSSLGVRQSIPVLHSTLDTQPGFLYFFSRPLALYSQWQVCVTLHISCP